MGALRKKTSLPLLGTEAIEDFNTGLPPFMGGFPEFGFRPITPPLRLAMPSARSRSRIALSATFG